MNFLGTGESYDVVVPEGKSVDDPELTFDIR